MYDKEIGYLYQKMDAENSQFMNYIYKKGSSVYNTADDSNHVFGKHSENRKQDFISTFCSFFDNNFLKNKEMLEVGCSTGYILNEFKKRGAKVLGCDPGPWKEIAKKKYNIEIIDDYFDINLFGGKQFDIIYSFAFLDQMSDPLETILELKKLLKPRGKLVTAVRNFSHHLELGNLFGLNPEHTIYFTNESVTNLYIKAGFSSIKIKNANYGYGLQIIGDNSTDKSLRSIAVRDLKIKSSLFIKKSEKLLEYLQKRINTFKGNSIGLMGACIETANIISLLDFKNINLFIYEFDTSFVNKYFSSISIKIKHENEIVTDKPDEVWIIPISHADRIEDKLLFNFKISATVVNLKKHCENYLIN
jgi:2-polyprenyl-3-methyl-5-hydroxy-6-metoxy-1,4-benzoquinol methylase